MYSNEWDQYANSIYRKHFKECDLRDIRTVDASEIPDFDLLCAGFPCPDFSSAGKKSGYQGKQGDLFFEIIRIAREKRPRYMLLENVKGFLKFKDLALKEIEKLGYEYEYALLNSLAFGVPQNRERVFIFCVRRDCCSNSQQIQRIQGEVHTYLHGLLTNTEDTERWWTYPRHSKQEWNIAKDETRGSGKATRIPNWMDRLRAMGNAVTPNVITEIAKRIPKG